MLCGFGRDHLFGGSGNGMALGGSGGDVIHCQGGLHDKIAGARNKDLRTSRRCISDFFLWRSYHKQSFLQKASAVCSQSGVTIYEGDCRTELAASLTVRSDGGTVLDPFGGSGTTAEVAKYNGRKAVPVELNPEYIGMIRKRLRQKALFGATG